MKDLKYKWTKIIAAQKQQLTPVDFQELIDDISEMQQHNIGLHDRLQKFLSEDAARFTSEKMAEKDISSIVTEKLVKYDVNVIDTNKSPIDEHTRIYVGAKKAGIEIFKSALGYSAGDNK